MKTCPICGEQDQAAFYSKNSICKICANVKKKERRLLVKRTVFDHYGSVCGCCGEAEIVFLALDHINNDGASQRKTDNKAGSLLYEFILKNGFPDDLQLLCHNCNLGRHINGGICPHLTTPRNSP